MMNPVMVIFCGMIAIGLMFFTIFMFGKFLSHRRYLSVKKDMQKIIDRDLKYDTSVKDVFEKVEMRKPIWTLIR